MKHVKRKSWLTVETVLEHSPAWKVGIQPGDRLVKINGHPIRDLIDYQFYSAEEMLECCFMRNSRASSIFIHRKLHEDIGLQFTPMVFQCCNNHCIFCFIDQNPRGMRQSLYFKDEDFRLSFLTGNYVTLTNANQEDLNRIAEQRLSPLYISIHATNAGVRQHLLGLKEPDRFFEKIQYLFKHDIEIHGQIVLCPGINDGEVLYKTLTDLEVYFPQLRSLALVPVGLTRYREYLYPIKHYNQEMACQLIQTVKPIQRVYQKKFGETFIYLADEFYLLSGYELPEEAHYFAFWQIENGVGLTRAFLSNFIQDAQSFTKRLDGFKSMHIVTGTLAETIIKKEILPVLCQVENIEITVHPVENRFFGDSVTVSGLITGKDIITSLEGKNIRGEIFLPTNCLNENKRFLDDLTIRDLENSLKCKVHVIESFSEIFN